MKVRACSQSQMCDQVPGISSPRPVMVILSNPKAQAKRRAEPERLFS